MDDPALSVPESVNIAAGARTATFEVTSRPVTKTTTAVITAAANGVSRTAPIMLRVDPATLRPPTTNYTITFSGLPGDKQPVTLYEEGVYRVRPIAADWESGRTNSALIFRVRGEAMQMVTLVGEVEITARDNTPFWLRSLALYSSTTSVPYVIEGFLSTTRMFSVTGNLRDLGQFRAVTAAAFDRPVDLVRITLTNTLGGGSVIPTENPMGFDDVTLSR